MKKGWNIGQYDSWESDIGQYDSRESDQPGNRLRFEAHTLAVNHATTIFQDVDFKLHGDDEEKKTQIYKGER